MSPDPLELDPAGRTEERRSIRLRLSGLDRARRLDGCELTWSHVRQMDTAGTLIFEFATGFRLDGEPLEDRRGERFLDDTAHRVDGTRIVR